MALLCEYGRHLQNLGPYIGKVEGRVIVEEVVEASQKRVLVRYGSVPKPAQGGNIWLLNNEDLSCVGFVVAQLDIAMKERTVVEEFDLMNAGLRQ